MLMDVFNFNLQYFAYCRDVNIQLYVKHYSGDSLKIVAKIYDIIFLPRRIVWIPKPSEVIDSSEN